MIFAPAGMDPPAAIIVAINPRPNQTPGSFAGITLVRHPSVQRVIVADAAARKVGRRGISVVVTMETPSPIVPFVNVTVCTVDIPVPRDVARGDGVASLPQAPCA